MNKTLKHIILSAFLLMSVAAMAQTPPQHVTVRGNVFGGGNMAPVGRGTTVLIDQANAVIEGDVYGGGAKAEVDTLRKASPLPALAVGDSILVNILQGSIGGDIYGGGLGNADTAANVYGPVFVNIGSGTVNNETGFATSTSGAATLGGSVYGCNNLNGTPKDNVYVNIYQTAHTAANTYPNPEPDLESLATPAAASAFAITAVYGGGNKAAYAPVDEVNSTAQVHIYACENTIQTVYGGGNAADATKVHTIIDGGFFDRVFGGGNGYSESGNHDKRYYDVNTSECTTTNTGVPCPDFNPGANITVSATTQIHGGLYRQVFGGSNQYGDVAGASLTIDKTSPCNTELIAEAFGGANEANITGNLTTTLACSSGSSGEIGNFYGGSNLADITGNVTLNVIGGTYTSVFGGSKGRAADNSVVPAITAKAANINGNVELNLHGGTMTNAFGGSDVNGNITGSITVNLNDTSTVCPLTVHNIYGAGRDAAYTPTTPGAYPMVNLITGTVSKVGNAEGNVFGGGLGETARVNSNPVVNLQGGTVAGTLFGGGSAAPVTGSPTVNANYGSAPVIHGGGLGTTAAVTGNPTVLFNKTADKTLTVTTVYGGGDAAPVEGNTTVTLTEGTLANAFGGGNVADITGTTLVTLQGATVSNIYGGGNQASVSSTSTVTLTSGTATTGVYGGCNASGTVGGAINVNVTGGTVGSADPHAYGVFGGGFGQSTATGDNVTVTIGDGTTTPTIYGDVYGGSAEGNVNDAIGEITKVWLRSGTVYGDIYGGGFGDNSSNALVNGSVQVVVDGGSMVTTNGNGGRIFGCNNANGTPKGTVTVEINSTDGTVVDPGTGAKTYALQGVYGGGNLAHYDPTDATAQYPVVTVNGCASSIKDVFGGGNAAAVPCDSVVINGGDIDRVFAGGNGTSGAANVGYKNSDATPSSGSYGLGTAHAIIKGGTINQVFGGSNNSGTIREGGSLNIDKATSAGACDMKIAEVYGGGNLAPGAASTINIGCTGTWTTSGENNHTNHNNTNNRIGYELEGIGNVYGGANQAAISTDITLNITSGIIENVFGGNNTSGNISGAITVNIEKNDNATCANHWYVGNVYGGGNLAAYQPTSAGSYPAVNIKNGTVSGNVFGGGLGATAKVYSNPVVTIGDLDHNAYVATVTGNVYGGGSAAMVGDDTPATASTNNTTVTIQKANSSVAKVFGGGMAAGVTGTTSVTITDGTVSAGLYGGCDASGTVVGNITVDANGGTIGTNDGNSDDGIFGGGYGSGTATSGNVAVTVDGSTIYGDVYGGSALGNVNSGSSNTTTVTLTSGTVNGNLYGGGLGDNTYAAAVNGAVTVNVNGGTVNDVYGCNNVNGAPQDAVTVNINSNVGGNVYGGGNQAVYANTPDVNMMAGTVTGSVFGGGNEAGVGGGDVAMTGGEVLGGIYGGCNTSGIVDGDITVSVTAGTVGANDGIKTDGVYGGGYGNGTSTTGDVEVSIAGSGVNVYGDVYGGSAKGSVNSDNNNTTTVTLTNGTVQGDIYGGGLGDNTYAAAVNGAVTVNVNGGTVNDVYGCNNVNGAPQDAVTVNINSNVGGNVYGGGNQAVYANTPDVNMMEGTVTGSVFGGGNRAGVGGGDVTMTGGTVLTGVYGGCNNSGTVDGNVTVNIKSGIIGSQAKLAQNPPVTSDVFGGGFGSSTATNGNVEVNIDSLANHAAPIIYGNVYGGSALGNVNNEATDHTTVNVLYGTLKTRNIPVNGFPVYHGGNVFGGGLGQTTPSPIEAKVYGVVTVNIGGPHSRTLNPEDDTNVGNAVIEGNVYGCNNTNGSPQDSVTVNIYRMHREATDQITYVPGSGDPAATYALHNVFGGGNQADYIPAAGATNKKLKVWIHDCYNSIERVFGGSNAAAAGAVGNIVVVNTLIDGGRFNSVFGGGNGEVDTANIKGNVDLQIHGGIVNEFFVGSNQNGSISGSSNVIVDQTGGCEEILITEFFCGGKYADFVGDINATITCSEGMHVTNLYGGCKEAHVRRGNGGSGNIHLRVYGGTFENVYGGSKGTTEKGADIEGNILLEIFGGTVTNAIFGGSNIQGAIGGTITVNVEQKTGADYCPLDVSTADVYGGGNKADYPGTPASDSPLSGTITHSSPYNYPAVNIKNATVRNVFGGGLQADVEGDPQIMIKKGSKITGNVYGGGNMGEVDGNPTVIINGLLDD